MRPKIFAVILNYNAGKDTVECLKSLLNVSYENLNLVVLDNNSPDNSMDYIKEWFENREIPFDFCDLSVEGFESFSGKDNSKITLIQTGTNKGYGHGNNIGIKYALKNGADYVLILNNDTVVSPDFIKPLLDTCRNDGNVGVAGGKIYFSDKPDTIWFNGGAFHEWTGKVEHFNFKEKDVGQIPPKEITFITGCMWLVPRQVFEKVGFINEEYFMYVEDLEFCYRVRKAGYKLAVNPESRIWHKIGGSSDGHLSPFSVFWTGKNTVLFIRQNYNSFIKKIVAVSFVIIHGFFKFAKKRNMKLLKSFLKGSFYGIVQRKEKK